MEIKINKEISVVKERVFLGMTFKQLIFGGIALGGTGLMFVLLHDKIDASLLTVLCALVAVPVMFIGFVKWQNLSGFQVLKEFIRSYILMPHEIQNVPVNIYDEMLKELEYNSEEQVKKRAKHRRLTIMSVVVISGVLVLAIIGLVNNNLQKEAKAYANTQYIEFVRSVDIQFFENAEQTTIQKSLKELKSGLNGVSSKAEVDGLIDSYRSSFAVIKNRSNYVAENFINNWSGVSEVKNNDVLTRLLNEWAAKIRLSKWDAWLTSATFSGDLAMQVEVQARTGKLYNFNSLNIPNEMLNSKNANELKSEEKQVEEMVNGVVSQIREGQKNSDKEETTLEKLYTKEDLAKKFTIDENDPSAKLYEKAEYDIKDNDVVFTTILKKDVNQKQIDELVSSLNSDNAETTTGTVGDLFLASLVGDNNVKNPSLTMKLVKHDGTLVWEKTFK